VASAAPEARGKALAAVFGGLTAAQVIGVPAGSFVGYSLGWASAFWITAALGGIAFAVFLRVMPRGIAVQPVGLAALAGVLADRTALVAVSFTASYLGAIWIVFAFLGSIIEARTGLGREAVTLLFVVYGLGAMFGNVLGGRGVDRFGPGRTLLVVALVQTALLPLITLLPWGFWSGAVLLFVWSLAGWAFMVPQQARLVALDPARAQVLLALNAAFIYVGAAIGPALGGLVKARYGLDALGVAAGMAGLAALVHLVTSGRMLAARRAWSSAG
jgi:predicted MFS family arabinose efflux permease